LKPNRFKQKNPTFPIIYQAKAFWFNNQSSKLRLFARAVFAFLIRRPPADDNSIHPAGPVPPGRRFNKKREAFADIPFFLSPMDQ
jgi:hypothetical protein